MDTLASIPATSFVSRASNIVSTPAPWSPLTRLGFRIAFLYFFFFIFCYGNGSVLDVVPYLGDWIGPKLDWPMNHLALWAGRHVFHLAGIAATWHPTGSGDTALHWILNALFVANAVFGGLLWTLIATLRGSRRTEYHTLYAWLRFLLRLSIGFVMLGYGMDKVFPLQMPPVSIAVLNEPIGQTSPMTLLWTLLAVNPVYQSICGTAEVIGGTLILFRRTALLGALVSAFVLTNVVLYNFFFDVPVKLFAFNLLLAALFVALPDVPALFRFFWLHRPAAPVGVWIPPARRRGFRIATRLLELAFTFGFLISVPYSSYRAWQRFSAAQRVPSPLLGAWHVESGSASSGAFMTSEGLPTADFYIDSIHRAQRRATDGSLWRTPVTIDSKAATITIHPSLADPVTYAWNMTDASHLVLTSQPPKASDATRERKPPQTFTPDVLTFTRIPVPSSYPLLSRGFHLVNEFGHQR